MLAKSVVEQDSFYDLSPGAKVLYLYLNLEADDDGFCDCVRAVMRTCGASPDDLRQLTDGGFLIAFSGGVVAVKHWKTNNQIRQDRYHPTVYAAEKALLTIGRAGEYRLKTEEEQQYSSASGPSEDALVAGLATEGRTGEDRKGKDRKGEENTVCAEPEGSSASVPALQLNDSSFYVVKQEELALWQQSYPAVDVVQQLREMATWCNANPAKRKTRRGIKKFIVNWLAGEQDKPHREISPQPKPERRFVPSDL